MEAFLVEMVGFGPTAVTIYKRNRERILVELEAAFERPLDEENVELVEALLIRAYDNI